MTPLVLLPGMMCDARLFAPQVAAFSGRRTIVCAPISEHAGIAEIAADTLRNAPEMFALAGLSMGGIVAMEILRQAPERVERIALMDTNPLAEAEEVKARRFPQMVSVREGGLAKVMRDEMKPNYLSDGPNRDEVLALCMDMALDLGPHVFLNQSRALMDRRDQTDTLRNARIPALVLCGRDDTLCPVSRHELMADCLGNATLEIIDSAGHLPVLESPEKTNGALARWLEA
ncbi:alpha/beta hydrolase [Shimia sp.]|uniref:alpha/beta fold hydrolase n=1 Tax=Shimia sp. TaxID=1954381 RepID=UPI00329A1D38